MVLRAAPLSRSVRSPYPYDLILESQSGGVMAGLMLLREGGGRGQGARSLTLEGVHPDPLGAASPTEFNYSAQNPAIESTTVYDDLVLGFGQRIQQAPHDRRYRFASSVDCSIGGQVILGPYLAQVTPTIRDSTHGISHFFEIGGSLYALNGRYCLKRTADTAAGWTVALDFDTYGAGTVALDVVTFADNTTGTEYAYVALGDSEPFAYFDGTTWAQHASLTARAWAVVGANLYRSPNTNLLAKVDLNADPLTAANWSADSQFRIGDRSSNVVRLIVNAAGVLLIMKTDGIYVLDVEGNDTQLYSDLKFSQDEYNGLYTWKYENDVITQYNGRCYAIGPDLTIRQIGPERFADNDSPVRGQVVAGTGTAFAAYAGIWNPDTDASYLMTYGAWPIASDGRPERLEVWHGSLGPVDIPGITGEDAELWAGQIISAMVASPVGAAEHHQRCYIGSSTGTITYFLLPCAANPLACTDYQYTAPGPPYPFRSGYVFYPYWQGTFPKEQKSLRAISVTAQLSNITQVSAFWARNAAGANDATAYTRHPDITQFLALNTPGSRYHVAESFVLGDFGLQIRAAPPLSAPQETPVVTALALHWRVNPPIQQVWELPILCEDGALRRDGSPMRMAGPRLREHLRDGLFFTEGCWLTFPDERRIFCQLGGYREALEWDDRLRKWRSVVWVRAIQSDVDLAAGTPQDL